MTPRPAIRRVVLAGLYCDGERTNLLSLGYLKATADARPGLAARFRISILESASAAPTGHLVRSILAGKPSLVGFSCFVWNIGAVRDAVRELKRRPSPPRVVLGGPEVSRCPDETLRDIPADYLVSGEGEETFAALLEAFDSPAGLAGVAGLSWRRPDGSVAVNAPRPPVPVLDRLPSPYALRLFDFDASGCERAVLETLRGCPFDCAFCCWTDSRKVRYFSEERIRAEVRALASVSRKLSVFVADSDTFMDRARAKRLLRLFREENREGKLLFGFNTYLGYFDRELAELSDSEHFVFAAGLESANPAVLRACRRKMDLARFRRGAALLRRHAPRAKVFIQLMLGMPEDTLAGFRRSLDLALGFGMNGCDVFQFQVLPGTGFWKDPEPYGLRWEAEPPYRILSTRSFPPADLREAQRAAYRTGALMELAEVRDALRRALAADRKTSPLAFIEGAADRIEASGAYSFTDAFARWERLPWRRQTLTAIRWKEELSRPQREAIAAAAGAGR